ETATNFSLCAVMAKSRTPRLPIPFVIFRCRRSVCTDGGLALIILAYQNVRQQFRDGCRMPGRRQRNEVGVIRSPNGRSWLLAALALAVWLPMSAWRPPVVVAAQAQATPVVRLIMVEDPGCPYCALWDKEVGVAYAASPEGRFAPLVRRRRDDPDVKELGQVVYSP